MRIIVTGSNGQLGQELQEVFKGSVYDVLFTTHNELDISSSYSVDEFIGKNMPDVIINCAAYTNVDNAEDNEDLAHAVNNIGAKNLANAAKSCNAKLIHISTDYVFDGKKNTPYMRWDSTNPIGVYGQSKLHGEENIIDSGCEYIIIRTSWLYSRFGKNFVKSLLNKHYDGIKTFNVVYDQVGSPTNAEDLAQFIYYIINSDQLDKTGIYHFANHGAISWYDFAKTIFMFNENLKNRIPPIIKPIKSYQYVTKATRPNYSVLDCSGTEKTFNYTITNWMDSLYRMLRYNKV